MSEHDDADPYLEYQRILQKAEDIPLYTPTTAPQIIHQQHQREHYQPIHQTEDTDTRLSPSKLLPNLIAARSLDRHAECTIKRPLPGQFLSPQPSNRNQQTRNEIRMKILLENSRLKASIDCLSNDLRRQRSNEIKIAQILKESKDKISEFKHLLKEKSRKISELTSSNIELRSSISDLEDKVNQINSYSAWQETQIRDLKKQLQQKSQQRLQQETLHQKIERLEGILKNYEVQVVRYEEQMSNTFSRSNYEDEIASSDHLHDRASENWGTMNELELKDIENLKQKSSINDEQYEMLAENNTNLRLRVGEVEKELEHMRRCSKQREEEWMVQKKQYLQKVQSLEGQIATFEVKSNDKDSQIIEREQSNTLLEKQIERITQEFQKKEERWKVIHSKLELDIEELNKVIDAKQEAILEITHRLDEKEAVHKKELSMLEHVIQQNEERFSVQWDQLNEKMQEVIKKNSDLENMREDDRLRLELEKALREEHEEREREAREFLGSKSQIEDQMAFYKEELAHAKDEQGVLSDRLELALESIKQLEEEKAQYQCELDKYAKEIQSMKTLLSKLSQEYHGREEPQPQRVIEEQEEESEDSNNQQGFEPPLPHFQRGDEQMMKAGGGGPLQEHEQLSQPQDEGQEGSEKRASYLQLREEVERLRNINALLEMRYSQEMEKLRQKFKLQQIELCYQFQQDKENNESQQKVKKLSHSVKLLQNDIQRKDDLLLQKQEELQQLTDRLATIEAFYEEQIKKLKALISSQTLELKNSNQNLVTLQIAVEKHKHDNLQLTNRLRKLEEENRTYHSDKLQLLQVKVELENKIEKLSYEFELQSSRKGAAYSRQIEQLKQQLQAEIGERFQEENKLYLSQQITQKQKEIEIENKQKAHTLQMKIMEMKNNLEVLAANHELTASENQQLRQHRQALEQEKNHLQAQLSRQTGENTQFKLKLEQIPLLEQRVQSQLTIKKELSLQIEHLQSERQVLESEVGSHRAQLERLRSKVKLLEDEMEAGLQQKNREIEEMKGKLVKLEGIINEQKSHIDKVHLEKQNLINSSLKQSHSLNQYTQTTKTLEAQNQALHAEIHGLRGELGQRTQQLSQLQAQKVELALKCEGLTDQLSTACRQNQQLQATFSRLQEAEAEKTARLEEQQTSMLNMKMSLQLSQTSHMQEVQTLMSSMIKQKSQMTVKIEEIAQLKEVVLQLRQEIADLQQKHRRDTTSLEERLQEIAKQKEELVLRNSENNAKIEELNESLFSFSETVKIKTYQVEQQQNSLSDLASVLNHKKSEAETNAKKSEQLEERLRVQAQEFTSFREQAERARRQALEELQITKRLMQEQQDDYELKLNKASKQMMSYKILLEEAQLESSQRLEQSSRSITNMKKEIKLSQEIIKQKEEYIKSLKEEIRGLKEQVQKNNVASNNLELSRAETQNLKTSHQAEVSALQTDLTSLKQQLAQLKQKNDQLEQDRIFTASEINRLQTALKEEELRLHHTQAQRDRLGSEKEKAQSDRTRISEDKAKVQSEKQELEAENLRYKSEMATLKAQKQKLAAQNLTLKQQLESIQKKFNEQLEDLSKIQSEAQQSEIEKKKMQYKCEMMEESLKKAKEELRMIEEEKQKEAESLFRSKRKIDDLEQDKEKLNSMLTSIERQHSVRLQSLREQQRDHYLEMERKYRKEVEELFQQLSKLNAEKEAYKTEKDSCKAETDKARKTIEQLKTEIQALRDQQKKRQNSLKVAQEEKEELSDKIVQLSQQNNELTEVVETLRNDLMSKNDQIYQLKEHIDKLTEQLNRLGPYDSAQSIPISIEGDRAVLEDMVDRLEAVNRQLLTKNDILQAQLNEKIKAERDLLQKYEKYRERQTRQRNNSSDSWVSRNKPFADEKSENLENEIEHYKLQLESAEAYIAQLEHQNKENSQNQMTVRLKELEEKTKELEKQNEDLRMKVDYQEAYIDHLQADNIKASIISKRSGTSRKAGALLQVDKDHSVYSQEQSHRMERSSGESNKQIFNKINMINDFIENYKKESVSVERQEQFRRTLNNPYLDELLNTIFYALERESNKLRDKQHEIAELEMENEQFQEEIRTTKETIQKLSIKIELYDDIEHKYQETKTMLEETLMFKLKQEASLAENKRYIEQLQRKQSQEDKSRNQKALTYSNRSHNKKQDDLSVLKEANEDEESESVMSADIDSEIPSEIQNSRDMRKSIENPFRKGGSQRLPMSKLVSIEGHLSQDSNGKYISFLNGLLDEIDKIEYQMAQIQLDLEEKGQLFAELSTSNNKSHLVRKLEEIQSKVSQNDREMRQHMEKSQSELIALIRQILRCREAQDQYGLQTENRLRIEECLNILEKELEKSSKIHEDDRCEEIKLFNNSNRLKVSLNSIREDASNEDKGSSILSPRTQGLQSRLKPEEAQQLAELRRDNSELARQLCKMREQLAKKEAAVRKINEVVGLVNKEIGAVFDDILMNCQENQYLMDQLDGVKKYLCFVLGEESILSMGDRNPSAEKLNESGKMILAESKRKIVENEQRKQVNHLEELLRLSNSEFIELGEELTNDHIKTLQKRLEEMVQYRYEDCMDFLLCEESLILNILKINEEESASEQTMERLANKFTRHEMANIIENCHNQVEARKILKRVLSEEQEKSESQENDFSPDPDKLEAIRHRIYPYPTELCLALHNKLLSILTSPTRQVFYDLIEQFYTIMKRFEDRIKEEVEERDSRSEASSIRMKKILEDAVVEESCQGLQKFKLLEYKNLKERSGSCRVPGTDSHVE